MAEVIREQPTREIVIVNDRDDREVSPRSNTGVIVAVIIIAVLLLIFFVGNPFGGGGGGGTTDVNITAPTSSGP